jgi:hypothetical protein
MLQIVYISSRSPGAQISPVQILVASKRNNARDGISGLLYLDATRFLQVLEGSPDKVLATFDRICADPRHRALVVLSRREVEAREFGFWAMADRSGGAEADAFLANIDRLCAGAAPSVRATFRSFIEMRHAADARTASGTAGPAAPSAGTTEARRPPPSQFPATA